MPDRLRLLIVALAALACGVIAVSAQSLGDVARREEQRRKNVKASGKVYTNRDLGPGGTVPNLPVPPAPGNAAAAPDAEAAAPAAPAEEPDPKTTEEYWRERVEAARSELQRNELFLEALQSRINALATDFVNRDDPAQRAVIANDRQKALTEMERVKDTIARLKQQIGAIEEEARQAGIPPGWIR